MNVDNENKSEPNEFLAGINKTPRFDGMAFPYLKVSIRNQLSEISKMLAVSAWGPSNRYIGDGEIARINKYIYCGRKKTATKLEMKEFVRKAQSIVTKPHLDLSMPRAYGRARINLEGFRKTSVRSNHLHDKEGLQREAELGVDLLTIQLH